MKAGIDRSLLKPLQRREPICKYNYIGSTIKQPVPGRTRPSCTTWTGILTPLFISKTLINQADFLPVYRVNQAQHPPIS